jgi:predicted amidohydrolase YtcJ
MLKRTRSNWQAINPDIVMFNGNIIKVDNEFSLAEAIAIKGATIIGVCSSIDIRKLAGENTRQIDLQGVTVLSGINDAHCHLNGFGQERPPMMVGLGYPSITSIADMKTATADKAAETNPGK